MGLIGKDIIGIDETHNGFHLNRAFSVDIPLVLIGYLEKNHQRSQKANGKYEAKGGIFTQKGKSLQEILKRARYYIQTHPNFYYTSISEQEMKTKNRIFLRAMAISSIVLCFFNHYTLQPNKTAVILDKINYDDETSQVIELTDSFLKTAEIKIPILSREKADIYNPAVKTADRIGYYLVGLRFKGKKKKWPFRIRKILNDSFLEISVKMQEERLPLRFFSSS